METLNRMIWGIPVLTMILLVGLRFTVKSRFAQFRLLPHALRNFWKSLKVKNSGQDGVSGFRALCTALAATVGTGNIAGVAGAIAIGGPGAVFWMWIFAFFGMATIYAEAVLAQKTRVTTEDGDILGGPKPFDCNDRSRFLQALDEAIVRERRKSGR